MKSARRLAVVAFSLLVLVATSAAAGLKYESKVEIPRSDARVALFENALRTVDLADGTTFVTHIIKGYEPFAMAGSVVNRDGTVHTYRAAEWLPAGFVAEHTAGQIFGATILDDGETVAASIGWTNAKGRNINGIAILKKAGDGWKPQSAIVVRGSVRDVAAYQGNRVAAVTVDPERAAFAVNLTVFNLDGSVYAMKDRGSATAEVSNQRAVRMIVQRSAHSAIALFDTETGLMIEFGAGVATTPECSRSSRPGTEGFFLYPTYAAKPCELTGTRIGSIAPVPEEAHGAKTVSIKAARVNADYSYSVAREVWDGTRTHVLLSTYGRTEGLRTVTAPVSWSAMRLDDGVARAMETRDGRTFLVSVPLP